MNSEKNSHKTLSYRVVNSGKTVSDVFAYVNQVVFQGHGPDVKKRGGAVGVMVDPVHHYERLMADLHEANGVVCLTFDHAIREPCPSDEIRCLIRHDVDIDVRTALIMAEIENKYGAKTSYYILHTSPYYGEFKNGVFYRNESMIQVYRKIQDLGHEIALHTDALLLYQEYGINGAEAIKEEIHWLRSNGIRLVGTTAHNSIGVYGAENFAIFKGRAQGMNSKPEDCPSEVTHNGKWAPLGVLDESELKLQYEANDIFLQGDFSVKYAATRGINKWRWQSEISRPILRRPEVSRPENCFVSHDTLMDRIRVIEQGSFLVLVVHPVYYGCRHGIDSGPTMQINSSRTALNENIGWRTYVPGTIYASGMECDETQEFQAISMTNELGMIDFPLPQTDETEMVRVAIFGGTNVSAGTIGLPAQMHSILAENLNVLSLDKVNIAKFSFPEMGLSRYFDWYKKTADLYPPDVVVLGVGANEIMASLPENWSSQYGFSTTYPPGGYLDSDGETVSVHLSTSGARLRQKGLRIPEHVFSLCHPQNVMSSCGMGFERLQKRVGTILRYFLAQIRADGRIPVILIQECGESVGLWKQETSDEQNLKGHDCFLAWLHNYTSDLDVNVIDPYAVFLKQPEKKYFHWKSVNDWSCFGHELAAEEAFRVMSKMNIFNEKQG